jgi:hypothetical protein
MGYNCGPEFSRFLDRTTASNTILPWNSPANVLQDYELRTVMPTLCQQIPQSNWTTRAWTYQEALLSPRCLYFTPHQVYFECSLVQCCESLDERNSPFHIETPEGSHTISACGCDSTMAQMYSRGIFRDLA